MGAVVDRLAPPNSLTIGQPCCATLQPEEHKRVSIYIPHTRVSIYIPHTRRNVRTRSKKDPRRVTISRVKTPSPILAAGILAASAITACADGIVQPVERRALLAFLREWDLLMWMGRNRVLNEFDCRTMHIQSGSRTEPTEAIEDLRVLAGKVQASLVATAAVQVALADGIACKRELRVLGLIRDRLGLANPAISDHRT